MAPSSSRGSVLSSNWGPSSIQCASGPSQSPDLHCRGPLPACPFYESGFFGGRKVRPEWVKRQLRADRRTWPLGSWHLSQRPWSLHARGNRRVSECTLKDRKQPTHFINLKLAWSTSYTLSQVLILRATTETALHVKKNKKLDRYEIARDSEVLQRGANKTPRRWTIEHTDLDPGTNMGPT